VLLAATAAGAPARAQLPAHLDLGGDAIDVGGEAERYLRVLQLSGAVPPGSWTVLPFTRATAQALGPGAAHPWADRFAPPAREPARWLRPTATALLNSTFPVQEAVGPVWAGRGLTAAVQAGVYARWRRLSLQLAPVAFVAQNSDFPLAPNLAAGSLRFADARFPYRIDHPQRFGDGAYGRVDLGTSEVALDLAPMTLGVSTAPQRWGPAREYPLVLGAGAGGFPHAFVGTSVPLDLRVARLNARLIVGTLEQSAYSAAPPDLADRIASAAVVAISPRGVDGLELGFTRFFESAAPWSVSRILRPFSLGALVGAVGDTLANRLRENQMASLFFRWALPSAGLEVYGEWYREDSPGDLRKLVLKPDDLSAFTVGLQRVFTASPVRRRVFRVEMVNGELSHQERGQRGFLEPLPPYIHSDVQQGHTQHGLLLGSSEAFGGAGWRVSLDDYSPRGRRTLAAERALRFDWLPGQPTPPTDVHPDVMYGIRFEELRFAGARDYTLVVVPAVDLNRDTVQGADRLNLHVSVRVRGW
jgi:hypothetical protein